MKNNAIQPCLITSLIMIIGIMFSSIVFSDARGNNFTLQNSKKILNSTHRRDYLNWLPTWITSQLMKSNTITTEERSFTLGTFNPSPILSLYIVSQEANERARVKLSSLSSDDQLMVRVFDPAEKITHWQYLSFGLSQPIFDPKDSSVELLPPLQVTKPIVESALDLDANFSLFGQGVHQVKIQGGPSSKAEIAVSQPLDYGVSFQNGTFSRWKGSPNLLYIYIPKGSKKLNFANIKGKFNLIDDQGNKIWSSSNKKEEIIIPRQDVIWRLETFGEFSFRAWGFPVILCTTLQAAKTIHASVEELPNGTIVSHKFQRRISELIPKILAQEHIGDANKLVKDIGQNRSYWLSNPLKTVKLLDGYKPFFSKNFSDLLKSQNVNSNSPWSGAFSPNTSLPWNPFYPAPSVGGNGYDAQGRDIRNWAWALGQASVLNENFNPYRGKKELLYRSAAASLRDLMAIDQAEVWPESMSNPYPANMLFSLAQKNLPPFDTVMPYMPNDIRAVWIEGLRHLVDRLYTENLVSARNQSAHGLVIFRHFANGSKDPVYAQLSQLYAQRFAKSANEAGWFMENAGPDASYNGITHWMMANYYRMSLDRNILTAIRKSYRFFDHTVAPEPNSKTILGGFNFNHRVGQGFAEEQWGGAKDQLANILPEVGVWANLDPKTDSLSTRTTTEKIQRLLDNPINSYPSILGYTRYSGYSQSHKTMLWPALEQGSFIRNFAGEMIAVKKPTYFVNIYVGKPASSKFNIRNREKYRKPWVGESNGSAANIRAVTPYLGGGLSTFWTPVYGTALMATNWSPLTRNGLVATVNSGNAEIRYWEDYFETKFSLDPSANRLKVLGKIEEQNLDYTRTYEFLDDKLKISLEIKQNSPILLKKLSENIPVVGGKSKIYGSKIVLPNGGDSGISDRFSIIDNRGHGVEVILDKPYSIRVCRTGLIAPYNLYQINRVEIDLFKNFTFKSNDKVFHYYIMPK